MIKPITLAFLDDDSLFSEALQSLLLAEKSFSMLFKASNGEEIRAAILTKGLPDILICDLKLESENGLDIFTDLRELYPELKAVALSSFYKPVYVAAALRNGFSAFLPKNCSVLSLIAAIYKVHETGIYYSPEDLALVRDFLRNPHNEKPVFHEGTPLSDREIEIIGLICLQYTNAEIAEKLFISVRTVEGHRIRILEKTGIRNSAGIVVYAITHGILDTAELMLREHITTLK